MAWRREFVYAKTLSSSSKKSASLLPRRDGDFSEEWYGAKLKQSDEKNYARAELDVKDREDLHNKLRRAGRDFDRGYINEKTYQAYIKKLLDPESSKNEYTAEEPPQKKPEATRPWRTQKIKIPSQIKSTEAKKTMSETVSQRRERIAARSKRERIRTSKWVERQARTESHCVLVTGTRSKVAVEEACRDFGPIRNVEIEGSGNDKFLVYFQSESAAANCIHAKSLDLGTWVRIVEKPQDCNVKLLRSILKRFGKVLEIKRDTLWARFETKSAAQRAIGRHELKAPFELEVFNLPPDARAEHLERLFGGRIAGGVVGIRFNQNLLDNASAIVTFDSAEKAARNVGTKILSITRRGGAFCALERAHAGARKGATPPWHSNCESRPFLDFQIHNFNFGHAPTVSRDFVKKAAGVSTIHVSQHHLAGSAARYASRRVKIYTRLRNSHVTIEPAAASSGDLSSDCLTHQSIFFHRVSSS